MVKLREPGVAPLASGPIRVDEGVRTAHILIVDDERSNAALLTRALGRAGFTGVHSALTAEAALQHCVRRPPDLLLLDVHMRGADGLELLGELRRRIAVFGSRGLVPVIVITGDPSAVTRERAQRLGAGEYLMKPFDLAELVLRAESLLALRLLHEDVASEACAEAQRSADIGARELDLIERLVQVSQHFEGAPRGHNDRVGELSRRLALEIGVTEREADRIGRAARLHDVGKIGVRDEILRKAGGLNGFELDLARRHTVVGALMLSGSRLPLLRLAETIALTHHERWDGAGYPQRLAGEAIPLAGRIVAVADVFDALLNERPYKPAWPLTAAVAEIGLQRGAQFDPAVVDAFLRLVQRGVVPLRDAGIPGLRARHGRSGSGSAALVRARRELRRLGLVGSAPAEVA